MSNSLQPHELQHVRLPYPSLFPGVCSDSCQLNWWCRPTISSSAVPFSCLKSFPASGSFPMSQLFASGGQSPGASASTTVPPMNIQDWFSLGLRLTGYRYCMRVTYPVLMTVQVQGLVWIWETISIAVWIKCLSLRVSALLAIIGNHEFPLILGWFRSSKKQTSRQN